MTALKTYQRRASICKNVYSVFQAMFFVSLPLAIGLGLIAGLVFGGLIIGGFMGGMILTGVAAAACGFALASGLGAIISRLLRKCAKKKAETERIIIEVEKIFNKRASPTQPYTPSKPINVQHKKNVIVPELSPEIPKKTPEGLKEEVLPPKLSQ